MEDVLDVYKRPFDPWRPVVCLDEKPMGLIGPTRPALPPGPGRAAREDFEYARNGAATLFVAFEPLGNFRRVRAAARRTRLDFAHFVRDLVDGPYKHATKVVLVMDNLNTHSAASLYAAFGPEEARRIARKLEIHYTPRHGSWLNMAEIELSVLGRRLPERIPDLQTLAAHAGALEEERNAAAKGADWQFTTEDARIKLQRLYPAIQEQ
jgi:hypothetical protein